MAKKVILKDLKGTEVLPITRGELVIDSSGKLALHSNEFLATQSLPGLMSPADKIKIDTLSGTGGGEYLSLNGGTMNNTNVVTNLNADLLDGKQPSELYVAGIGELYKGDINFLNNHKKVQLVESTNDGVANGFFSNYTSGLSVVGGYGGWQMVTYYGTNIPNPRFRGKIENNTWHPWKSLAFITDNVASATKLENSRIIWGNIFDGTDNVDGNLILNNLTFICAKNNEGNTRWILGLSSENELHFGGDTAALAYPTIIYGGSIQFRYGTSKIEGMRLTSTGNVLIGTTTDSGYKLDVNGVINTNNNIRIGGELQFVSGYSIQSYNSQPLYINNLGNNLYLCRNGGNVGIGTNIDSGYKLDVNGKTRVNGVFFLEGKTNVASTVILDNQSYGGLLFKTSSSNRLFVGENIGIGTINPSYKLDVNGTIHTNSSLHVDSYSNFKGVLFLNSGDQGISLMRNGISWHNAGNVVTINLLEFSSDGIVGVTNRLKISDIPLYKSQDGVLYIEGNLETQGNVKATSFIGNLDGAYINTLTGYIKAESPSDLVETDTLNIALGKLEYKAGIAYSWYRTITEDDTDEIINKWDEVVDFVNGLEVDLTEEFVTKKTNLTITGIKTFSSTDWGKSLIVHRNLDTYDSLIQFSNKVDGILGYIGIGGSGSTSSKLNPYWSNGTNAYKFWHTGNLTNLSQLNNDLGFVTGGPYLPLSGGTITGHLTVYGGAGTLIIKNPSTNALSLLNFANQDKSLGFLGFTQSGDPLYWTGDAANGYLLVTSKNYTSYLPFLNSSSAHASNTSVIYAPSTAGTKGLILTSNGSGAPVWSSITSLKNPYAIKFKKTDDTAVSYDGSTELDLTEGIRYATKSSVLSTLEGSGQVTGLPYYDYNTLNSEFGTTGAATTTFLKNYIKKLVKSHSGISNYVGIGAMTPNSVRIALYRAYSMSNYNNTGMPQYSSGFSIPVDGRPEIWGTNNSNWYYRLLAYTTDIPTKVSLLENDSGYVTGGPYLPLTGGILAGATDTPLVLRGDTISAWIAYLDSSGTHLGSIGVRNNSPVFYHKTINNNTYTTIWHSGNDGSGSGLDADLLDGKHASHFATAADYVTLGTSQTITGLKHFNTNNNSVPLIISRTGSTSESVKIGINDGQTIFDYTNDETSCYYIFKMTNTDKESGNGNSNTSSVVFSGNSSGATVTANKFVGNLNHTLTFSAGTFTTKTYNNSAAITVNIPTKTSHLTNDSNFFAVTAISKNTDINTLKGTTLYYIDIDGNAETLTNAPYTKSFAMLLLKGYESGDDLRRYRLAIDGYGAARLFNDRDTANTGGAWVDILTSKNSEISGDGGNTWGSSVTIKINGIEKTLTIPANPNVDTKVTQTNTTTTANYRVLLSGNANDTTETTTARKSGNLLFNPKTGLSVYGSTHPNVFLTSDDFECSLYFTSTFSGLGWAIGTGTWGVNGFGIGEFHSRNECYIAIKAGGYVGVHTTNPTYDLDINGNTAVRGIFRMFPGDATLAIYADTSASSNYGTEGISIQTTFDGEDPVTSSYPSLYPTRGVLQLQPRGGNVAIGKKTATSYKVEVEGDVYCNNWFRTSSGFYIEGKGVHYYSLGTNGVGEIYLSGNNEFCWSTSYSNTNLYFNYRAPANGTAVTHYLWNAGSSTSWAVHTAGHYYEPSDRRLKTNISSINTSDNMPIIKEFNWKTDGLHSYGLIALELEEMGYLELVNTNGDYKTVDYSVALSLIVGKLQVKIRELEKEIENLKNKN